MTDHQPLPGDRPPTGQAARWDHPQDHVTRPQDQTSTSGDQRIVDHRSQQEEAGHSGHGRHRLMMIACCVPMLVIVGVLVATGVVGSGFILYAVLCTVMMAVMMFMMPGGHKH
jgi:Flp pilus assembly protein TadB